MISPIPLIIIIIGTILSAFICHQIAKRRGARPVFWGVMGVIFGPFAIPFAFLSKGKKTDSHNEK